MALFPGYVDLVGTPTLPGLPGIDPRNMTVVEYGRTINDLSGDMLTKATISRSMTQASTVQLTFADNDRALLNSSPICNEAITLDVGAYPSTQFRMVQVQKAKNEITVTFEDAVINRLRRVSGQVTAAPNILSRGEFVKQLVSPLGIPFVEPPPFDPYWSPHPLEALTRGTSQNPTEDTWTCITRLAQGVAWRAFADGHTLYYASDQWLFLPQFGPVTQVTERTNDVDFVDFDYDVGKPSAKATLATYDRSWTAPVGSTVWLNGLGPASGQWLVSQIDKDMFHTPLTVQLLRAQPTLPEPSNGA